ncbi:unnamed protein product [Allacma fusca]|uniref:Arrestin C-terminal-like domain-containing protein n=1 Tax=Allacma fusca TaxID=39272 RepID=A0A8J2L354_9HEXA|nr:unnamed protein product [Allacma fusca]
MGLQKFQIEVLENPILAYAPGDTITGQVHLVTVEECKLGGIQMRYSGKASAEWLESDQTKYGKTHFVEEVIFCWQEYIFGSGSTQDLISPGDHVYRFVFKLPQGLPTSFVNKEAKVRYEIEAVMERGWKPNVKARVPFTITGCLDLNKIAGIAERVGFRVTRNLSCFFCTKGMVGFEVAIPKQGFVCGEYIEFNAEMFNQSRKHVHGFLASLVQKAVYRVHAHDRGTTFTRTVCSAQGPRVEPGGTEVWSGNVLRIPPLPPSHLATFFLRVIDIQYSLRMEMVLPGIANNLSYEFPVTIGTIPIRSKCRSVPQRDSLPTRRQSDPLAEKVAGWLEKRGSRELFLVSRYLNFLSLEVE